MLQWIAPLPARALLSHRLCSRRLLSHGLRQPSSRVFFSVRPDYPHTSRHAKRDALPIPLPPPSSINDAASWMPLVEPFLPRGYRRPPNAGGRVQPTTDRPMADLALTLLEARKQSNVDILSHIGSTLGRWEAMIWIYKVLAEACGPPSTSAAHNDASLSTMSWPESASLDELSSKAFTPLQDNRIPHHATAHSRGQISAALSDESDENHVRVMETLGHVWRSLAALVLEAAERDPEESAMIISKVLRVLANLHRNGWIPDDVYKYTESNDPSALRQPPLLESLSSTIFIALADAEYASYFSDPDLGYAGANESEYATQRIFEHAGNLRGPQLRPELWLEFILWCCVHGGWLTDGAAIIADIGMTTGPKRWGLMFWHEMTADPRSRSHGQLAAAGRSARTEQSRVEKVISAEVIAALVDGLVALAVQHNQEADEYSLTSIFEQLSAMKNVLARDSMSLGVSSWDGVIAKLSDSCRLQHLESNPRLMELILGLAEPYGREVKSPNAATSITASGSDSLSSYVFDGSAAIIGLYHHLLQERIKMRDIDGALRLLARLQSFTDQNKQNSMDEFFAKMKKQGAAQKTKKSLNQSKPVRSSTNVPSVDFPAFHPHLPIRILADLMDLIADSEALEVGRWMLYSTDIDGPLIPTSLYGDQRLAPALIRFAAVTRDTSLLSKLTGVHTGAIAGPTLVSLFAHRIQCGNYEAASQVFEMIGGYLLHSWTILDVAMIVKVTLPQIYGHGDPRKTNRAGPRKAASILERLLRDVLHHVHEISIAQIDTVVAILSTLDEYMAKFCSSLSFRRDESLTNLPTESFNALLDGIVRAQGSERGREVYEMWCRNTTRELPVRKTSESSAHDNGQSNIAKFFGLPPQQSVLSDASPRMVTSEGNIVPNIATLRVVVHQTLKERRRFDPEQSTEGETGKHGDVAPSTAFDRSSTLDWAASVLRDDFGLSDGEIDYELQGYLSSQQPDLPPALTYSVQTFSIWRALGGKRQHWARAAEEKLRDFAANTAVRQFVSEPIPPPERFLLHCLAADLGLVSESEGDDKEKRVTVSKTPRSPTVPPETIAQMVERGVAKSLDV